MVSADGGRGAPRAASTPPGSADKSIDRDSRAQFETPDTGNAAAAAARAGTQAWNAVTPNSGAVIGGPDWPALSESARPAASSKSSDTLKPSDAVTVKSAHVVPPPPAAARQQSARRPGVPSNGEPPPPVLAQMPEIIIPSPYAGAPRGGGFHPHPHGGNDHHRNYGGNRRGNNNGGGSSSSSPHHNNRRDLERGVHDWNHWNRDIHMQQQPRPMPLRGLRPYMRPLPPVTAPFIPPPPPQAPPFIAAPPPPPQTTFIAAPPQVRPFVPPMGYPDMPAMPPPMYYVPLPPPGLPFLAHPPPPHLLYPPAWDAQRAELLKQIEYYFSPGNLCSDIFLRQKMDNQGWVPVSLIANFNLVKKLTNNIQYILDTLRKSAIVEVEGEKLRRCGDWKNWLLSSPSNNLSNSTPHSLAPSNSDTLATHLQAIRLDGDINQNCTSGSTCNDVVITRSASGNLSNQLQAIGGLNADGSAQVTSYKGPDRSMHARGLARSDTL